MASTFPEELWDCICQFCSTDSLQSLHQTSPQLSRIARPYLYRAVTYIFEKKGGEDNWSGFQFDPYWTREAQIPGLGNIPCADPGIVIHRESEVSESEDEDTDDGAHSDNGVDSLASLETGNDEETDYNAATDESEDIDEILMKPEWQIQLRNAFFVCTEDSLSKGIINAINIISKWPQLESIHVSLAWPKQDLHLLDTSKITSITTAVPFEKHLGSTWWDLLPIFHIPTLRHVCLDSMDMIDITGDFRDIPAELEQRFSNVTSLTFVQCGHMSPKIHPLLLWPKQLKEIRIDTALGEYRSQLERREGAGVDELSSPFDSLEPVENTLEDLKYLDRAVTSSYHRAIESKGFKSYSSLKRLEINIGFLMTNSHGDHKEERTFAQVTRPIQESLPPSIEEIHFRFEKGFPWNSLELSKHAAEEDAASANAPKEDLVEGDATKEQPSKSPVEESATEVETSGGDAAEGNAIIDFPPEAEELLQWLSGLAHHRDYFSNLRRVKLDDGHSIEVFGPPRWR